MKFETRIPIFCKKLGSQSTSPESFTMSTINTQEVTLVRADRTSYSIGKSPPSAFENALKGDKTAPKAVLEAYTGVNKVLIEARSAAIAAANAAVLAAVLAAADPAATPTAAPAPAAAPAPVDVPGVGIVDVRVEGKSVKWTVTHEGLKAWLIDFHRKKQAQQLLLMQQQDHPDDLDEMDDPEWFEWEDRAREERQERAELLTAVKEVNNRVTEVNSKLERCLDCMEGLRRDVGESNVAATEMENEIVKMSRKINKIASSDFWKNKIARINADAVAPAVEAIESATCKLLTAAADVAAAADAATTRNASSAMHVPMVSVNPRMVPVNPVAQEATLVPHPARGFTTTAEAAATASATMGPPMNFSDADEGLYGFDDDDFIDEMTRRQFGTYT